MDDEFAEGAAIIIAGIENEQIINNRFNHLHATFLPGIKQCSNWRRNLVPDESGPGRLTPGFV